MVRSCQPTCCCPVPTIVHVTLLVPCCGLVVVMVGADAAERSSHAGAAAPLVYDSNEPSWTVRVTGSGLLGLSRLPVPPRGYMPIHRKRRIGLVLASSGDSGVGRVEGLVDVAPVDRHAAGWVLVRARTGGPARPAGSGTRAP
jgi:hypothetical protein